MAKGGEGAKRPPAADDAAKSVSEMPKTELALKQELLLKTEPGFYWRQDGDPHALRYVNSFSCAE